MDIHDHVGKLMAMRDLEEIFALENDTDFAIALSSASNGWTGFGKNLEVLSAEAQSFYLCNTVETEVNSDGFVGCGRYAPATVDALETVGASKTADIVRRAIALLPNSVCPEDYIERENILFTDFDGYSAAYDKLDEAFYQKPDGDLQTLYVAYAKKSKNAFAAPA